MLRAALAALILAFATGCSGSVPDEPGVRDGAEPRPFTLVETERAFDAVSLEVEPTTSGVFLKPVSADDFVVVVFDAADEAEWSYGFLERQGKEIEIAGVEELLPRRGNVLVYSGWGVSDVVRKRIERALARIS